MRHIIVLFCILGWSGEVWGQACPVGQVVPKGTACSISDYTVGGPIKGTDAVAVCQQPGGCNATSPVITYTQVPMSSLATFIGGSVTPQSFGAKCDGTTDDSSALSQALSSGTMITFNSKCAAASAITVNGCPYVSGFAPEISQILFTTANGGLNINCTSGSMSLRDVAILTNQNGGGTGVSVTCGPQQPTLLMDHVTVGGTGLGNDTTYWTNGVVVNNCRLIHIYRSYLVGKSVTNYSAASIGLLIENTAGISSVLGEIFDNVVASWANAIEVVPSHQVVSGEASIEGLMFRDNALITNTNAFHLDASGAGYTPPGFFFIGNQTESFGTQPIYFNNIAQGVIADNVLYTHSATGAGLTLVNVTETTIHDNRFLALAGSTGAAVDMSVGANLLNNSHSNFTSGFGVGTSISATSNYNLVMPNINSADSVVQVNNGVGNTIVDLTTGGTNELTFYANANPPLFNNGFTAFNDIIWQANTPAQPPNLTAGGALTNNYSGGAGEINVWNTQPNAGRSFEIRQETAAATNIPLFSVDSKGGINVGGNLPVISGFGAGAVLGGSSNDAVGIITTGTGGSTPSATITYSAAKTNAPACLVIDNTVGAVLPASLGLTNLTIVNAVPANHQVIWHCFGLVP